MIWHASVTLESDTQSPRTSRIDVVATSPSTAAARAVRAILQQHKGARFSWLVVVLEKPAKGDEAA